MSEATIETTAIEGLDFEPRCVTCPPWQEKPARWAAWSRCCRITVLLCETCFEEHRKEWERMCSEHLVFFCTQCSKKFYSPKPEEMFGWSRL